MNRGGGKAAGGGGGGGVGGSGAGLVDSVLGQKGVSGASKGTVVIKFFKQGFVVDDGELRSLEDPKNQAFLDSIQRGVVPDEIMEKHPSAKKSGSFLDVQTEDHRQEDYVPPA